MRTFGDASARTFTFGGRVLGLTGAVASEHYLSAQAGMDMYGAGGNAFDAAAAAALAESVVNAHMFSLGGECPLLARPARPDGQGRVYSVNGNTKAPAKATLSAFTSRGLSLIPPRGVIASGVPAALDAILTMLERWGSLPFEVVAEPARRLARDGFPVHEGLFSMPNYGLADNTERFAVEWPASAALYLTPEGSPKPVGTPLKNPALAALFDALIEAAKRAGDPKTGCRAARDFFHRGEPAAAIGRFSKERDGLLARADVEAFETLVEAPVSIRFRGASVYKCGPWSQGPVFLQLLRILDNFDLAGMGHNSADSLHLWLEAAKLAYADREQYYADPALADVPMAGLLSREYGAARARLIDMQRASPDLRPGDPRKGAALLPEEQIIARGPWGPGTVHVAAADKWGNLAALTPSGGWITGNEIVPELGFALTTRLQTFYLDPRHPNAPAPGKRPRTTLSPSLAFFEGGAGADGAAPWEMAFGTMGGDQQDQWTSQFFLNRLIFGMLPQEAIEAPKITSDHFPGTFHPHDAAPGRAKAEGRIDREVLRELERRGHEIIVEGDWSAGFICAASRDGRGVLEAAADPRGAVAKVFPATALAR